MTQAGRAQVGEQGGRKSSQVIALWLLHLGGLLRVHVGSRRGWGQCLLAALPVAQCGPRMGQGGAPIVWRKDSKRRDTFL